MRTIGLISANYISGRFEALTEKRTLASLPYGGRYRLIDFALSNMVNSGIQTVGVISPYNSGSLIDHVGIGEPWGLDRKVGGLFMMPGSVYGLRTTGSRFLLKDIIDNRAFLQRDDADYILMTGSSDVYNMDYRPLIEQHQASGCGVTAAYVDVDNAELYRGYFLDTDDDGKVTNIDKYRDGKASYFMDCCVINKSLLLDIIEHFKSLEHMDLFEIIGDNLSRISVGTYKFDGYLGKINNIKDYMEVSVALADYDIRNELFFNFERRIMTKVQDEAPVFYGSDCSVKNSMVSAGCRIEGTVENSIIFRSTHIAKDAVVRNSVIMMHGDIGEGAELDGIVCDKYVTVAPGTKLSKGGDEPMIIEKGKTI